MNALNLSLTLALCILYLYRTYFMCAFDKEPIWYMFEEDIESDEQFLEKFDNPDRVCNGEANTWYYYILLPIAHIYFLLEFILRASVQKY